MPRNSTLVLIISALCLYLGACVSVPEKRDSDFLSLEQFDQQLSSDIPQEYRQKLLDAEIAGAGGETDLALRIYLETARLFPEITLVERAQQIALNVGDLEAFSETALILLQLDPDSLDVRQRAAQAMVDVGEIEAALEIARQTSDSFATVRQVAARTARNGSNRQREWLLNEISDLQNEIGVEHVELHLARAVLLLALDEFEGAEEALARGLAADENHLESNQLLAQLYARRDRIADAIVLMERLKSKNPNNLEVGRQYAFLLIGNDSEAAILELEQLAGQFPESSEILIPLAQLYANSDQLQLATDAYKKLLEQEAYRDASAYRLGELAERMNDEAAAIDYYKMVGPGEAFGQSIRRLGEILLEGNRIDEFSRHFSRLEEQHPESQLGLIQLHTAMLRDIDAEREAIEVLSGGLKDFPGESLLLYDRALLYAELGDIPAAEMDLRTVINNDPENDDALNALGYTLLSDDSRIEEGFKLIQRALELDPEDPATLDSMGWALYKMELYDQALPYLERALDLYYDPEVIEHVALTLDALGHRTEAIELVNLALRDFPDDERLLRVLIDIGGSF